MWFELLAVIAAVAAGALAAVTGFGIGSLLTPVLALQVDTRLAVAAVSIPHVLGTALRFWLLNGGVDRRVLWSFGATSARRVRGSPARTDVGRARQRDVVEAFLRAVRSGDLEGLLAVLDPDAVHRIDAAARVDGVTRVDAPAAEAGKAREIRGASTWAKQMLALSRGLDQQFAQPALIDGSAGFIFAPRGKLARAVIFTFADKKIARIEAVGDPARLRELDIAVL